MLTGRCLCGEVTYELAGDLIATAVCHCDHCQRQSGGAFSVNLVAHESQLTVNGELRTYEETGEPCDCLCTYNLAYTLTDLSAGDWTISAGGDSTTVTVE